MINAYFIRDEKYPTYLSSVINVKKKWINFICINFKDLNKVYPKDEFPLSIPNFMVDIASSYAIFSFMDSFFGYNEIKMALEVENNTTFMTSLGVYCYRIMPFGLTNIGATSVLWPKSLFNSSTIKYNVILMIFLTKVKIKRPLIWLKNSFWMVASR